MKIFYYFFLICIINFCIGISNEVKSNPKLYGTYKSTPMIHLVFDENVKLNIDISFIALDSSEIIYNVKKGEEFDIINGNYDSIGVSKPHNKKTTEFHLDYNNKIKIKKGCKHEIFIIGKVIDFQVLSQNLKEVRRLDNTALKTLRKAFKNQQHLKYVCKLPNTVKNISNCFEGIKNLNKIEGLKDWDVSNVINFKEAFKDVGYFNVDISNWKFNSNANFKDMFKGTYLSSKSYSSLLLNLAEKTNITSQKLDVSFSGRFAYANNARASLINKGWQIIDNGEPMILEIEISNPAGELIELPIKGKDIRVHWGDGLYNYYDKLESNIPTHGFSKGKYTIEIFGGVDQFSGKLIKEFAYLKKVKTFGLVLIKDMVGAYYNAINLIEVPSTLPYYVTDLSYSFENTNVRNIEGLENLDISKIKNMTGMFKNCNLFNKDITKWDFSNVQYMDSMFSGSYILIDDYCNLLNALANKENLKTNVKFDAGNSGYYPDKVADAKQKLKEKGWQIKDRGAPIVFEIEVEKDHQKISLPVWGENIYINWGDIFHNNYKNDIKSLNFPYHYYNKGTYSVEIYGEVDQISNSNSIHYAVDFNYLRKVKSFGDLNNNSLVSLASAFVNANNLNYVAPLPKTVVNLKFCFKMLKQDKIEGIENWSISKVGAMNGIFFGVEFSTDFYNKILENWSKQNVYNNIIFDAHGCKYNISHLKYREALSDKGWTINDGGCADKIEIIGNDISYVNDSKSDFSFTYEPNFKLNGMKYEFKAYLDQTYKFLEQDMSYSNGEFNIYTYSEIMNYLDKGLKVLLKISYIKYTVSLHAEKEITIKYVSGFDNSTSVNSQNFIDSSIANRNTSNKILTNIESNNSFVDFKVFPNPAAEFLKLRTNNKYKLINVYNYNGEKITSFTNMESLKSGDKEYKINLDLLKNGNYIFKFIDYQNKSLTKQIIINK